ncbi:Fip1 motif-domain-containing protein [Russula brevipes]|nr:Fip1 motif-domain-containing protein [Russula brevipes]
MEPANRSLDLRPNKPPPRPANATPQKAHTPGPSLTTEYTPRERGGPSKPLAVQPAPTSAPGSRPLATPDVAAAAAASVSSTFDVKPNVGDGPDPTTLPPVAAPPSHPAIDPTATGMLEGRPVFEVDMTSLADKAWRRPGSDISDWFNYGFDEISWEAYCYRRRELGDLADVLKTNVVNFSGMPEDQLTQLPPEIRTMVMTGTTAMMANGGAPMMQPGMNPMMGPEMGNMNMGPQMIDPMMAGMGGEMGMDGVGVGVGVRRCWRATTRPRRAHARPAGWGGRRLRPARWHGSGHDTRVWHSGSEWDTDATAATAITATAAAAPATTNAATAAPTATTAVAATATHVSKHGRPRGTVTARGSCSRHSAGTFPRPAWHDAWWAGRVHASRERWSPDPTGAACLATPTECADGSQKSKQIQGPG